MNVGDIVRRIHLGGMTVEESDDVPADDVMGSRSWGAPRVTVKQSQLVDLEPAVRFHRGAIVIYYGDRVGDLVHASMSKGEVNDLAMALGRRVVRELHDSACEMAQARRSYMEDRQRRLANKG